MLFFDIDNTLVRTHYEDSLKRNGEVQKVFGFELFMEAHLLEFLRSREDIHLLSTWDSEAVELADAFSFKARTLLIRDYSDEGGIYGKFAAVRELQPKLWADDQITTLMGNWCLHFSVVSIAPKSGSITISQLAEAKAKLNAV